MAVHEFKRVSELPVLIQPNILYLEKNVNKGVRALLKSDTTSKISVFGRTVWMKGDLTVPYSSSVQGSPRMTSRYEILNYDSFTYYMVTVDQPSSLPMEERFTSVNGVITLKLPTLEECPSGKIKLVVNNEISIIDLVLSHPDSPTIVFPQAGYGEKISVSPTIQLTEFSSRTGDVLTTGSQKIQVEIYKDSGLTQLHGNWYSDQSQSAAISGLSHNTDYWVRARYNGLEGGWGDWSPSVAFTTTTDSNVFLEKNKLVAGDAVANAYYGRSVVVSQDGRTVAVGADGDASFRGSVYIYKRSGDTWTLQGKLSPTGYVGSNVRFGASLALSDDGLRLAVGAYADNDVRGAVYIFEWNGATWVQQVRLTASDATAGAGFGWRAVLYASGNSLLVTAQNANSNVGAVYLFTKNGTSWTQQAKIVPWGGLTGTVRFGGSIALSKDQTTLFIGCNADPTNGTNAGSVFVYTWNGSSWVQSVKILPSDGGTGHLFGINAATDASGTTLYVTATGYAGTGAVYIYKLIGGVWVYQDKVLAPDGQAQDSFGFTISVTDDGNKMVVGAYVDDDMGLNSGSLYLFTKSDGVWSFVEKLYASDEGADDRFSSAVSMTPNGNLLAVSSYGKDGLYLDSGSVYLFS